MNLKGNYEDLARAIVVQAVDDWKDIKRSLRRLRGNTAKDKNRRAELLRQLEEVEGFFRSDWFTTLTGMDGGPILRRMQEELL